VGIEDILHKDPATEHQPIREVADAAVEQLRERELAAVVQEALRDRPSIEIPVSRPPWTAPSRQQRAAFRMAFASLEGNRVGATPLYAVGIQ